MTPLPFEALHGMVWQLCGCPGAVLEQSYTPEALKARGMALDLDNHKHGYGQLKFVPGTSMLGRRTGHTVQVIQGLRSTRLSSV